MEELYYYYDIIVVSLGRHKGGDFDVNHLNDGCDDLLPSIICIIVTTSRNSIRKYSTICTKLP